MRRLNYVLVVCVIAFLLVVVGCAPQEDDVSSKDTSAQEEESLIKNPFEQTTQEISVPKVAEQSAPVCGNGILEIGEYCDIALEKRCAPDCSGVLSCVDSRTQTEQFKSLQKDNPTLKHTTNKDTKERIIIFKEGFEGHEIYEKHFDFCDAEKRDDASKTQLTEVVCDENGYNVSFVAVDCMVFSKVCSYGACVKEK